MLQWPNGNDDPLEEEIDSLSHFWALFLLSKGKDGIFNEMIEMLLIFSIQGIKQIFIVHYKELYVIKNKISIIEKIIFKSWIFIMLLLWI